MPTIDSNSPGFRHLPSTDFVDHPSHAKIGITPFRDRLYVVTMLENPNRWRSRYQNYWQFEKQVRDAGAILFTVEVAFGDRDYEVTEAHHPHHVQLRTRDELWHKENALNIGIQHLPSDAKYVAWIDADVLFLRPDWAQETLQLLQHYDVIQMWSKAQDIGPRHEPWNIHTSFVYEWLDGNNGRPVGAYQNGVYKHPGFAWAARIDALEKLGMLLDWSILGSGDYYMACCFAGERNNWMEKTLNASECYRKWFDEYYARSQQFIKQNVGYMPGMINHLYHGSKLKRKYEERWQFLLDAHYDPSVDLKRDRKGLYQLNPSAPNYIQLRNGIRKYNRAREEDEGLFF